MNKYRYGSPYEWIVDKIGRATRKELQKIARILINVTHIDQIHDLFDLEMDENGYFDPTEET